MVRKQSSSKTKKTFSAKKSSSRNNPQNNNKTKKTFSGNKSSSQNGPQRRKLEVVFDKDKRKEHLTQFSKRKRERRIFGLAMQKVKDRKKMLYERKGRRNDEIEKDKDINQEDEEEVVEAGKNNDDESHAVVKGKEGNNVLNTTSFQDEATKNQFGGEVCVTTTYGIPEDSDEEELENYEKEMAKKTGVDERQRICGSVQYYIKGIEESTGGSSKKADAKKHKGLYHKGTYGAQNMQGIAKGKDFKIASMALRKAHINGSGGSEKRKGKGRGRRKIC